MGACKKPSLVVSVTLSLLSFFISLNNTTAQDFLKKFLGNSLIKKGKEYKTDGDYPSAITTFTKSIKEKPENLEAHYQLGLIFEDVFLNYDKAVSMYKNVITNSKAITPTGDEEELKEFNTLIANARKGIDRVIKKEFDSIENPIPPVYIIVKSDRKIFRKPTIFSSRIYKSTIQANEFRLLNFEGNWYQINISSVGLCWIPGKYVLKFLQKEKDVTEISITGKAAQYERFANKYPESRLASDAKKMAYNIYYELAKNDDAINSYSVYLEKYPDGMQAEEFRLRKDELTFKDNEFLNSVERLQFWIEKNPESTFLEKAKVKVEELTFAQTKHDKDFESLERYLNKYPQGRFVTDVKQMIEDLKYEQAKLTDTVDSYKKYLDEYHDGKYIENATKGIDEREFTLLLKSYDTELLSKNLKIETNKNRLELINSRIEELTFNNSANENTIEAFRSFTKEYSQGKFYEKAIDSIEVLEFNVAKDENTIEAYNKFLGTHPKGKYYQTAKNMIGELVFDSVKKAGTVSAYKNFIKQYPECKYTEEARLKIDQLNYEYYQKKDTLKAYKKFVKKYPESRYVNEAREKISQMSPTKKTRIRNSGISIGSIIFGLCFIGVLAAIIVRLKSNVSEKMYHGKEAFFTEKPPATINLNAQKTVTSTCPSCKNVTVPDKLFCIWCDTYVPNPKIGKKAVYSRRLFATAIDPIIPRFLCTIILVMVGIPSGILENIYLVFFLWLLSKGITPGKWILGEKVVDKLSGSYPGYWRMFLREVVGKFVSVLAFGLGYPWLWAVWDKNSQMWHDKIAGTVVVYTH